MVPLSRLGIPLVESGRRGQERGKFRSDQKNLFVFDLLSIIRGGTLSDEVSPFIIAEDKWK